MIDADVRIREFLLGDTDLATLVGTRIFAGVDLPAGYTPDSGPAILFSARGGPGTDESGLVLWPSYQFRSYGSTEAIAAAVDRALFDAFNYAQAAGILAARLDVYPQLLRERGPEPGWPFALSFYQVMLTNP